MLFTRSAAVLALLASAAQSPSERAADVVVPSPPAGATAAELARSIRGTGLDPQACYRVRDLAFSREDIRFYLTDGYLILGKPIAGRIFSAVFVAAPETGDAEVIVSPPNRSERASLARYIDSPTLNEHLVAAVFLFSDNSAVDWLEQLRTVSAP
ncbi:MAG TPA: hypothetical protein VFL57_18510, partial [Bryobacteraceae bacterium]|nr:hypothetical protein [Bryobacteraceae bacterium]